MKYITEYDLRTLYKKAPFTSYQLESQQRLTPEARQFLLDRNIEFEKYEPIKKMHPTQTNIKCDSTLKAEDIKFPCCILDKLQIQQAKFLAQGESVLEQDLLQAQKLFTFAGCIQEMITYAKGGKEPLSLPCTECSSIKTENFSSYNGACFQITGFHIQLAKGKQVAKLHLLRCEVEHIYHSLEKHMQEYDQQVCCKIGQGLCQIINALNLLICLAVGGESCQR